jgi:hypothetical protein
MKAFRSICECVFLVSCEECEEKKIRGSGDFYWRWCCGWPSDVTDVILLGRIVHPRVILQLFCDAHRVR